MTVAAAAFASKQRTKLNAALKFNFNEKGFSHHFFEK
jgi:hypothetical protein